jgi:adenylate kinase
MKKKEPKRISSYKEFLEIYDKPEISYDIKKIPCIIMTGPPGCGKGTQAEILKKEKKWTHISTGEILRKSEDKEVKKLMKTGKLLPDELVAKELENYIKENDKAKGFIFDGYPRNLTQKDLFYEIIKSNNIEIKGIFYLNVPEEILKERIKERGKTSGRTDDKDESVFDVRMKEYNDQTFPMIQSMMSDENFVEISGEKKLKEVNKIISKKLDEI